jgi:hypothetical protein
MTGPCPSSSLQSPAIGYWLLAIGFCIYFAPAPSLAGACHAGASGRRRERRTGSLQPLDSDAQDLAKLSLRYYPRHPCNPWLKSFRSPPHFVAVFGLITSLQSPAFGYWLLAIGFCIYFAPAPSLAGACHAGASGRRRERRTVSVQPLDSDAQDLVRLSLRYYPWHPCNPWLKSFRSPPHFVAVFGF